VPPALVTAVAFPAPAILAGRSVTIVPPALATAAAFYAPAITTGGGVTVIPATLAAHVAFPAPQPSGGAVVYPPALFAVASFPAPQPHGSATVFPAVMVLLAAFPAVRVAPVVWAGEPFTMRASASMRVSAGSGPDIDALWTAYRIAADKSQASADYWAETKIAGGTAGQAGTAFGPYWADEAEAQRLWHAWQMAVQHWERETSQFAAYGGEHQPGPALGSG